MWLEVVLLLLVLIVEAVLVVAAVRWYDRRRAAAEPPTSDALREIVAAHESLGADERKLIDEVLGAGQRTIGEVMVPRTEVAFLEADTTVRRAARQAAENPHQRYPVFRETQDDVVGFVTLLELLQHDPSDRSRTVGDLARDIEVLPGSKPVLAALSELRRSGARIALVVDEYGGTDGIVTLDRLVEEIVGEVQDGVDSDAPRMVGGGLEVDGMLNLDEVAEVAGLELPDGPYATLGGFVMAGLGSIPTAGAELEHGGYTMTVVAVDGRRAARIRLSRVEAADAAGERIPTREHQS